MTISVIIGRKTLAKIDDIVLDASLDENHEFVNDITEYAVESGSNISDHIRKRPEKVTISGVVTNSPVPLTLADIADIYSSDNSRRSDVAFNNLMRLAGYDYPGQATTDIKAQGEPVTFDVVTGLVAYTDMAISRLSIPRSSSTGDALKFTIELQKIRRVTTEVTEIQNLRDDTPEVKQADKKVDSGKQTTSSVTESTPQSLAYRAFRAVVR